MKKRIITVAAFAACLALWATVWPQNQPAGETAALPTPAAVIATQPEVPEIPEIEEVVSDNMVYVPGFGWIESQGPNHMEYAEDMYENGNKIGIMG